jgi:hypothetical protein
MSDLQVKAFDLGHAIARATHTDAGRAVVEIVSPLDSNDGGYVPAQSVGVFRREDVQALRDACDFALNGRGSEP